MHKFTATLLAAALVAPTVAAPAMAAPDRHTSSHADTSHSGSGHADKSPHQFRKGEKFDQSRATHYQAVDYRKYRNVKAPPRGYHYVRSGNDLLLVGITSGIVAAVTSGMFR